MTLALDRALVVQIFEMPKSEKFGRKAAQLLRAQLLMESAVLSSEYKSLLLKLFFTEWVSCSSALEINIGSNLGGREGLCFLCAMS